jgi:hypothetical protein
MNRRSVISFSTVTALGLALCSSNAIGQSAKDLVGTWTIVSAGPSVRIQKVF